MSKCFPSYQCAKIINEFGVSICVLRTENAKQYFGSSFVHFISQYEIVHQTSCSYTPQRNGSVKHKEDIY